MVREPEGRQQAHTGDAVSRLTTALLLHEQEEPMAALTATLGELGMRTIRARNCAHAEQLMAGVDAPLLLFCDSVLPDGTWADALKLAGRAPVPVNVIVVARFVNIRFYVEVIERGAFDFVTPPFVTSDISHVVRCAAANLVDRRVAQARTA
jgi:DNA-binding NtrC family response regulator